MDISVSLPQVACLLVNRLFTKLVVSEETRTRTEAARPWVEILAAENIPVIFDEEDGDFVVSPEALAMEYDCDVLGGRAGQGGPESVLAAEQAADEHTFEQAAAEQASSE